jgi:hypothetical protein
MDRFHYNTDSPSEYEKAAFQYLIEMYGLEIKEAIKSLLVSPYLFQEMQNIHQESLRNDIEIIFRQNFPICVIWKQYFPEKKENLIRLIKIYCLCQTLILNNIDRHLDYKKTTSLMSDHNNMTCYVMASLYNGVLEISKCAHANKLIPSMITTTLFIIQHMHANYANRFDHSQVNKPHKHIEKYLNSNRSRHLGSGFYESGIRSVFGFNGVECPKFFSILLPDMRRLRQRVDEIDDLFEDLFSGIVSYPLLLLLTTKSSDTAKVHILVSWDYVQNSISVLISDRSSIRKMISDDLYLQNKVFVIKELLLEEKIFQKVYLEAHCIWETCCKTVIESIGKQDGHDLLIILDQKRAFLERIKKHNWNNKYVQVDLNNFLKDVINVN